MPLQPTLFITGGNGLVGSNISLLAREKYRVVTTWYSTSFSMPGCIIEKLDITDKDKCKESIKKYNPDCVIHSAIAYKSLGACEHDTDGFHKAGIFDSTVNIAKTCKEIGAKLIFISTDWVFNGKKAKGLKYSEKELPSPSLNYGVLKFSAEQFISKILDDYLIIRIAFVYGHNYAKACLSPFWSKKNVSYDSGVIKIAARLREGEFVYQPEDIYQSPTYAPDLGRAIIELWEKNKKGVFHVAGSDSVSRYQFFKVLADSFGLKPDLVKKCTIEDFLSSRGDLNDYPEIVNHFPLNTALDISKLENVLNFSMSGYREGLNKLANQISIITHSSE